MGSVSFSECLSLCGHLCAIACCLFAQQSYSYLLALIQSSKSTKLRFKGTAFFFFFFSALYSYGVGDDALAQR